MKGSLLILAVASAFLILLAGCASPQQPPVTPPVQQPPGQAPVSPPPGAGIGQQIRNCETAAGGSEILQCYGAIFQEGAYPPSVCEATGVKTARQACYVAYAASSNDVAGICTTNKEASDQDECIYAFGVQNRNAEDCGRIGNEMMRGGCYGTVAAALGDAGMCEDKGKGSSTVRDSCFALLGGLTGDSSVCGKVQNVSLRDSCNSYVEKSQ